MASDLDGCGLGFLRGGWCTPMASDGGKELEAELMGGGGGEGESEEGSFGTHLDLTSYQLHDLGGVDITETLVELDLTANRLTTLDKRISFLSRLKKLSLRQNLFDDDGIAPISQWTAISGLQVSCCYNATSSRLPSCEVVVMSVRVFERNIWYLKVHGGNFSLADPCLFLSLKSSYWF